MRAELYGVAHISFIVVLTIFIVVGSILGKKKLTEKGKLIFMRVMGGLTLIGAFLSRFFMARFFNRYLYLVPNSYCGLTGFIFGVALLTCKPNSNIFHCLWYMAFVGGLVTMVYPDFFVETPENFFHPKCFFCMFYHGMMLAESIFMLVFNQFKLDLKKVFILPLGLLIYIAVGYFEIYVLNEGDSMSILNPMLSGTPINCWFILIVGSGLAFIVNLIIYFINKSKCINRN